MTTTALPHRCLRALASAAACAVLLAACAAQPPRASNAELQKQVADTERAFAKSMADRDFAAEATRHGRFVQHNHFRRLPQ